MHEFESSYVTRTEVMNSGNLWTYHKLNRAKLYKTVMVYIEADDGSVDNIMGELNTELFMKLGTNRFYAEPYNMSRIYHYRIKIMIEKPRVGAEPATYFWMNGTNKHNIESAINELDRMLIYCEGN